MKQFWTVIQLIFSAVGGWLGYFLGGCDGLLYTLLAFVVLDYATGVMAAIADHKLSSAIGFRGIFRKVLIFALVGVGHLLDVQVLGSIGVLRTAVIFFYLSNDDNCYCKYYEVVYILFHTGMRISEFFGLTISDIDFEHHLINIDHQLQRSADMTLVIQKTKTHAGTRKLPMTADVEQCFRAIIEDRPTPKFERMVDGRSGFLFLDKDCLPEVAMYWEHRFNHMVKRYNDIYRVQMPNITPHVCRHTYCSNQAKAGMNPKTLQYLMGHSDIGVTLNITPTLG